MTETSTSYPAPSVRFGRLERRGVLLGLSAPQLCVLGTAFLMATAALYVAGAAGLAAALPIAGPLALLAVGSAQGRPLLAWAPILGQWLTRRVVGQTRWLAKPWRRCRPAAVEELALPGDAARLRVYVGPETGAALVHDPHQRTLTAVLAVGGAAFALQEPATQQRRVAGYGRLLAGLCQRPEVTRVQVLDRTTAEPGNQLRSWWTEHGVHDGSWAARILSDLVETAGPTGDSIRHQTYIALTIDTRRSRRARLPGGALSAAVAVLERQTQVLSDAVDAAELRAEAWLGPGALAQLVRTAFDPAARLAEQPGPALAGPMAVEESWDCLRADAAHHAAYWVAEWPRAEVGAGFLQPLVLQPGVWRSLSIVAEPLAPARSARDIRRARVEHAADAATRRRVGRIEDEAIGAEAEDVVRRERDLADGHGELRFTGMVTVSASSAGGLVEACGQVEQAAAQAMCELRRLYGQQAQAFTAAALPLTRGLR